MKVLSVVSAGAALASVADGFSLTMNGSPAGRSALAAQYKSIMSIHSGLGSGGAGRMAYPTMMPPPTDPDPEVRPSSFEGWVWGVCRVVRGRVVGRETRGRSLGGRTPPVAGGPWADGGEEFPQDGYKRHDTSRYTR